MKYIHNFETESGFTAQYYTPAMFVSSGITFSYTGFNVDDDTVLYIWYDDVSDISATTYVRYPKVGDEVLINKPGLDEPVEGVVEEILYGTGYHEPWVSYTGENGKVAYNRTKGVTIISGDFRNPDSEGKYDTITTVFKRGEKPSCEAVFSAISHLMDVDSRNLFYVYVDGRERGHGWHPSESLDVCGKVDHILRGAYNTETHEFSPFLSGSVIRVSWGVGSA